MPIFEKPVDPAEIDADSLAYEVTARLQKQRGVSVVTVGTTVKPSPWDDPHLDHADSGACRQEDCHLRIGHRVQAASDREP
jgi:hypothetical protein